MSSAWQALVHRGRVAMTILVIAAASAPGIAAACTLMAVPAAAEAKLKVFFTNFESEDKTGGKYRKCRLVKKKEAGTETFFITPFRQDANVVVHKSNWPK